MHHIFGNKHKLLNVKPVGLILYLFLVGGCGIPLTDNVPPGVPKGYIEFYQAENKKFPAAVKICQVSNGQEQFIGSLGGSVPKRRVAARPGLHTFTVECGTLKETIKAEVFDGKITPVGILITVIGVTQSGGLVPGERITTTYFFEADFTVESPIPFYKPSTKLIDFEPAFTTVDEEVARTAEAKSQAPKYTFKLALELKGRGWVKDACFSPVGDRIASVDDDRVVKIWDSKSGALIRQLKPDTKRELKSVCFSADGRLVASGTGDPPALSMGPEPVIIQIWDCSTGQVLNVIDTGETTDITDICFSYDSTSILSVIFFRKMLKIWDVESGSPVETLAGHADHVRCVDVSPDGRYFASSGSDRTIKIWDATSGKPCRTLGGHKKEVESLDFSSDGKYIVSCDKMGYAVKIWDILEGKPAVEKHIQLPLSVAFSPDGNFIAVGDATGNLHLLDAKTGAVLDRIKSHPGWLGIDIIKVDFSPDSRRILSAANDNTIKIWAFE